MEFIVMQTETLRNLVKDIHNKKFESQNIEVKTAEKGCPTRLFDTLSSYSNQDEGGIIIFGLDEREGFSIKGVYNAQDLQKKLLNNVNKWNLLFVLCSQFVRSTEK